MQFITLQHSITACYAINRSRLDQIDHVDLPRFVAERQARLGKTYTSKKERC